MTTFGSLVVARRVATIAEVDEALARQVVEGGDLATCLLEVSRAPESTLAGLLAEASGMEAGPSGELPAASDALLRLVPLMIAEQHGLYPLEEQNGELKVAVSAPLGPLVEEDLTFALGVRLRACAAPIVRIRQALARDYGAPLDRRFSRLIARLEERRDAAPNPPRGATLPGLSARRRTWPGLPIPGMDGGTEPRTVVVPPEPVASDPVASAEELGAVATTQGASDRPDASRGEPLPAGLVSDAVRTTAAQLDRAARARRESSASRALVGWARRTLGNEIAADRPPEARRGPLTPADAERRILLAQKAEDALATYFAFSRQYFEYAALFFVQGDLAEGHDAAGPGARRDQVRGVGVALDLPSILASARARGAPVIGKLSRSGLDEELRSDLARAPSGEVIVIPVMVRGRCVALLYGDDGDTPVELGDIGEVLAFGHLVAGALETILLRRKQRALGHGSSRPPPPRGLPVAELEVGVYAPAPSLHVEAPSVEVSVQELVERAADYPAESPDQKLASSSMSAEPQLPPNARRVYRELPPVLIRPELVDQVIGGGERGERALGEILALGEAAIPSVFARFPGPLTVDRRQPIGELPRPADCGPVLRILAAMRRLALPFLAVRSADVDVEVRFWATYLLGELNYTDAGQALFPRLFDESPPVRKIAARAARNLLAGGDGGAPLRKSLERLVIYSDEAEARRVVAIATLAELRLYRSIPALIAALADPSFAVSDGAASALSILTRLDFGHDARKWHDWWESKGQKRLT